MAERSRADTAGGTHADAMDVLREVILTGVAVLVPGAISVYVLWVFFQALHDLLLPIATYFFDGSEILGTALAVVALVAVNSLDAEELRELETAVGDRLREVASSEHHDEPEGDG